MKRFVFLPGNDPARAAELAALLLRSGIEVTRTRTPFQSARAHAYYDDAVSAKRFAEKFSAAQLRTARNARAEGAGRRVPRSK